MSGSVVVDTNLMLLLVVGLTDRDYVSKHKCLQDYSLYDYDMLRVLIAEFSDIVVVPHILAEISNLSRQIGDPAKSRIMETLKNLIIATTELPVSSLDGAMRDQFRLIGLPDSVLLHLCDLEQNSRAPTLLTVDTPLANIASSLGYSVIDYKEEYQAVIR